MATEAELIETSLLNVAQQLADLTTNPKPSYGENGRSVSWGEHMNNLLAIQEKLRAQLVKASGPFTVYG
jgi:1,2-phenylacetyl-CoA epoxidase catalytic subunit